MNRGYSGFYKQVFLRSSYEYAYARYLDHHNIRWKYEEKYFQLTSQSYKPDFFIYTGERLVKIVEVKCRDKRLMLKATRLLDELSTKETIETELITYEKLLFLYKQMPCSLNSVITEWISSPATTVNKSISGENNPHFNHTHTTETKKTIGEHTKKLWSSNPQARKRMLEGLRKTGLAQKGKIKTQREKRFCIRCNAEFTALITSPQTFCTQKCAGKTNVLLATEKYVSNRLLVSNNIEIFIHQWSMENKELVLKTPFNKIKTSLDPLLKEIEAKFGVKDMRVISKAIFGEDKGRKELLSYMKSYLTQ